MSYTLPALRTASIRASAVEALRTALLSGSFRPGESLSEPALAARMGISRGPVREALLILEQEGLVVYSQNRGFAVLTLGAEDRRAMVKVRIPLESLALKLARERVSAEDLRELEGRVERLVAGFQSDPRAGAREDLAFHERIWELADNAWLRIALRRIAMPFFQFTMMYLGAGEGPDLVTYEEQHRNYVDYLRGTSGMTAEACVEMHLATYEAAPGRV